MKSKLVFIRICAILILLSFFLLIFSAFTLSTHHCHHDELCAICDYYSEQRGGLFIPVLCVCATLLLSIALYHFLSASEGFFAVFTPVKLKVKLSD